MYLTIILSSDIKHLWLNVAKLSMWVRNRFSGDNLNSTQPNAWITMATKHLFIFVVLAGLEIMAGQRSLTAWKSLLTGLNVLIRFTVIGGNCVEIIPPDVIPLVIPFLGYVSAPSVILQDMGDNGWQFTLEIDNLWSHDRLVPNLISSPVLDISLFFNIHTHTHMHTHGHTHIRTHAHAHAHSYVTDVSTADTILESILKRIF